MGYGFKNFFRTKIYIQLFCSCFASLKIKIHNTEKVLIFSCKKRSIMRTRNAISYNIFKFYSKTFCCY